MNKMFMGSLLGLVLCLDVSALQEDFKPSEEALFVVAAEEAVDFESKSWSDSVWQSIEDLVTCVDEKLEAAVTNLFGKVDRERLRSHQAFLQNPKLLQDLFAKNTGKAVSPERVAKIVAILEKMMNEESASSDRNS